MKTATAAKPRAARAKITPAQRRQIAKYLFIWNDIFEKFGWALKPDKEKKALRHSVNSDIFGEYIEPSRLNNEQWTVMFYALEMLQEHGFMVWSKEMAGCAVEDGLRRMYIWWIERAGLDIPDIDELGAPDEYIADVASDKFGGNREWRALTSRELWQLFITIKNRVRKAHSKGKSLYPKKGKSNPDDPF